MARYAYNVDTTQKFIDVHKQFNGGLKTVDTDDSLGAVFLRQAENISLSEFGFIEKRYGTHLADKFSFTNNSEEIQGYWEYYEENGSLNEIAIVGGRLYLKKQGQVDFTEIKQFRKEGNFKYDNSFIGTETVNKDFLKLTFQNNSIFNPITGQISSASGTGGRTDRLKIKDIEGFNVLNALKVTDDIFSFIAFWDESLNYLGFYGSPQHNIYQNNELIDKKLGKKPVAEELFTVPLEAAYIGFVFDNSTYQDEEDLTKYIWGQSSLIYFNDFEDIELIDTIGGTTYQFSTGRYPFQKSKEVSAVQIKDYLYIFNGTYPIYYKGGSSFYFFPMYTPSSVDVVNAGHNYFETRDFEEVYGYNNTDYTLSVNNNFLDPSLDFEIEPENSQELPITPRVAFTKQEWYPKLPYAIKNQQKGELNFELNYNYSAEVDKIFDPYLKKIQGGNSDYTDTNYTLKLDSLAYAGANSASNSEYIKINPEKIDGVQTISNYTRDLNPLNKSYAQFRVRDEFALFRNLISESNINSFPSPTHGTQANASNPVLNTDELKRNFLGKERKHPYGIDAVRTGINRHDMSLSIEETIFRSPDSGNLSGNLYGIRFKRETSTVNDIPVYEKLDFKDLFNIKGTEGVLGAGNINNDVRLSSSETVPFPTYASQNGIDAAIDKYLSSRFAVIIRPITAGYAIEDKEYWKVLYQENTYFQDQILYFKMPEFPDRIDNEAVTGYAVDIKTVEIRQINTPEKRLKYKESYNGKASRSIRVIGEQAGIVGLQDLWPQYKASRSKLDYNMFSAVSPEASNNPFGSAFKATITDLIPGTYDFKITFALDETKVVIDEVEDQELYTGDYVQNTHYYVGDLFKYNDKFYECIKNTTLYGYGYNLSAYPEVTNTEYFKEVSFLDYMQESNIQTDTQFISVYFRNIQIFGEKVEDYKSIKESGVSPILSCTKAVEHYGKILLFGSGVLKDAVFVSYPQNFNYFPSLFKLDFTTESREPVQAITPFMNVLVVQTLTRSWGLKGSSPLVNAPDPYSTFVITPAYGTVAPKTVKVVRNQLFFLSHLGVVSMQSLYMVDQQYNIRQEDTLIRNLTTNISEPDAIAIQYDDQYWLNLPKSRITLRWYIEKKSWVLDKYNWNEFNGVFKYTFHNNKLAFITKRSRFSLNESSGFYKIAIDKSLPTDLFEPIVSRFETSYLNQNYPFHPKNYKETKMDFTIQNEYNLGRAPIYQMNEGEHISVDGTEHTISNIRLLKNHTYNLDYNFTEYTTTILDMGIFNEAQTETLDLGLFSESPTNTIDLLFLNINFYGISIDGVPIDSFEAVDENTLKIDILDSYDVEDKDVELVIKGDFNGYDTGASLIDASYDSVLDFKTWIVSEERTLNLDNLENYDQPKADIPIQLGTRLGDWVFGTSDFGNKVTLVKTIKLSGKGYNSKVYFEDYSRSKWTLESLGIVYKMKRPRSR